MLNNRHVTAIVIARGGSKGLAGKNYRPLLGRPVVAYTLGHARNSPCLDLTALSTDDERIAAIGKEAGVKVIGRPAALASDTARVDDALRHAVETLEGGDGLKLDVIVLLYGNVPVRRPGLIDTAVSIMTRTGCDSVQSFAPVGKHHPWWMYQMDRDGRVSFYDDHQVYRRQELCPLYIPDGAVIVLRREVLMASGSDSHPHAMFGRDRRGLVQPADATIDIDGELDLLVAEAMLRRTAGPGDKDSATADAR